MARLSRLLAEVERFLGNTGFDRAPWLTVAFGAGIGAWFALPTAWHWLGWVALCLGLAGAGGAAFRPDGEHPFVRQAAILLPLALAAGCLSVWARSELVGTEAIARPMVVAIEGRVLSREDQPAMERTRLVLATRLPERPGVTRVRVNLPAAKDDPALAAGAIVALRVRLMPPAPPMLPGGYNFARKAWFSGLAATGSLIGDVEIVEPGPGGTGLARIKTALATHVQGQITGSEGGIATALATGDPGAIAETDAQAMRDAGLAHLLSISGLHVSAVIGAAYLIAIRLLALWPWLALRVRLPIVAAGAGALAGIAYTLLTGAQVPTVRSCVGALLVLAALALGRQALSLRMLAVAAFLVLLLWPESIVGPSFQMSFAAVLAIVALSGAEPVRRFLAPREEPMAMRTLRFFGMLLLTGVVIELVLMPIGLYHFHRAGAYGAIANIVAIPLTTTIIMPMEAIALLLDVVGLGAPAWWIVGSAIEAMLAMAHWIASRPGAVTTLPAMGASGYALFVIGGLWLGLWSGAIRFWGLVPAVVGAVSLLLLEPPDILVSGDGKHVGITGLSGGDLLVLREARSDYVRDNLTELAGMTGDIRTLEDWPEARCSREFCVLAIERGGRIWRLLMSRGTEMVPERALAASCERADIVISDRWLPYSCRPTTLKVDRRTLSRTGGLTIDLDGPKVTTVAESEGRHGWWRSREPRKRRSEPPRDPGLSPGVKSDQ
ncbi:ComEC/Rec2 family competence protein [Novosphingobium aquimarinum]|uniref:ComEC/Rec2 family competence protein n=1 Tax=Novosphingobium aquimarinum TaxID=2682494 RepID=UPI001E398821|nr:ComEC/Rec2 family competence protein [Novosphingobium aquimarinum]